ncbi:hypothetical protein IEN85_04590 [Pelagicoccus sp. NFK12]|uniref:Histidine kinase/HSP90-like ATPase domain-containing protein n=1 Tax=Pelagicoccus enzymogenes TaxID=2773457 RepID=A0A927F5D1_9BACT|nr:ATP-binding protein [Pelagicoccus enzymogenes]MBD5778757.1 hypothetical protein [Pelagicoccus enzymogenes]
MPQIQSQHPDQLSDPISPEASSSSETLFLLSICRDEDDAAALRADLKRSGLGEYKIQRCVNLDDALQLMQVCGFDLAFIRLDDFQNHQAAIELVRQHDPELAIVALTSHRLLNSREFQMPSGVDGNCRLEDLSPTLVSNLVSNILGQKRDRIERQRLKQELSFALEVGEMGTWSLDIETGRITLSKQAYQAIEVEASTPLPFLDDLLEIAYPPDQDRLKRLFDLSIESQGDFDAKFRLSRNGEAGPSLHVSAIYRPGGPRTHPTLAGLIKREQASSEDIQSKIEAANEAIRKALALRDEAIATASKELESLAQTLKAQEQGAKQSAVPALPAEPLPAAAPPQIPPKTSETTKGDSSPPPEKEDGPPQSAKEKPLPASQDKPQSPPRKTGLPPLASVPSPETSAPGAEPVTEDQTLGIDKSHALQQVLKSINKQKGEPIEDAFPFDFSTETVSNYTEPSPQNDGFIGAAKRLIDITQNGHDLAVTLSVDNDGAIESERERDLLFEILKELLTNVVKHARATECIIALFRDEDDWVLQVEDDGVGLENNLVSISTPLNKIGLFRIRTKLALKGGQLDLTPTFPKGLIARARLPVYLINRGAERA